MKRFYLIFLLLIYFNTLPSLKAQKAEIPGASAFLEGDTLSLQNGTLLHQYLWNRGDIILVSMTDKRSGKQLEFTTALSDFNIPEEPVEAADIQIKPVRDSTFEKEHLSVEIVQQRAGVGVKRVIQLYPESPAVRHIFYYRGHSALDEWEKLPSSNVGMIETRVVAEESSSRMALLRLDNYHWGFKAVAFKEATDYHDDPVAVHHFQTYRQRQNAAGNILVGKNRQLDIGFFIIKESPIGAAQAYYPGYDFQFDQKQLTVHGLGMSPTFLSQEWIRGYGYALGLTGKLEQEQASDLIQYQKQIRNYHHQRDGMILANTWGDRSKDSRMNEPFIVEEIKNAGQIGITHLQLDDGWQQGLSRNSANKSGVKWDDWSADDWKPHSERFPNGLENIALAAEKAQVEICLWFNPSKTDNYKNWERDADILIGYYQKYGIRVFKVDGLEIGEKQAEVNLRKLFEKVMEATSGRAVFNMDVTAGKRVGFHFFQEFGNVFLENRYTDWGNYYPHRSLRNLWSLSSYLPTERIQLEFLNTARNRNKYPQEDPLAPGEVGQDYSFATTLTSQPLAWMELSQWAAGRDRVISLIENYKPVSEAFHTGITLPIGEMPNGFSWTGFRIQSKDNADYLVVYREHTEENSHIFSLPAGISKVEYLFGDKPDRYQLSKQGLTVEFEKPFSFTVFSLR